MQHYFPHDSRFNAENFAFQPVSLILQALEWGARIEHEHLHLQELGIATLSSLFINANRDPKKSEPAKPQDFFYFNRDPETDVKISATVADTFFSMSIDQSMPFWVPNAFAAVLPKLRSVRANGAIIRPRGWFAEEKVALIAPQIKSDKVFVPLGVVWCAGIVTVEDIDTGMRYAIDVPKRDGEPRPFVDQTFELSRLIL